MHAYEQVSTQGVKRQAIETFVVYCIYSSLYEQGQLGSSCTTQRVCCYVSFVIRSSYFHAYQLKFSILPPTHSPHNYRGVSQRSGAATQYSRAQYSRAQYSRAQYRTRTYHSNVAEGANQFLKRAMADKLVVCRRQRVGCDYEAKKGFCFLNLKLCAIVFV